MSSGRLRTERRLVGRPFVAEHLWRVTTGAESHLSGRGRPRTGVPSRWQGAGQTCQRRGVRRPSAALQNGFACQPGQPWFLCLGLVFARAVRRSLIATPRENPIARWLTISALGHSAGGPDALHDAGAFHGGAFGRAALRHAPERAARVGAAIRCGVFLADDHWGRIAFQRPGTATDRSARHGRWSQRSGWPAVAAAGCFRSFFR